MPEYLVTNPRASMEMIAAIAGTIRRTVSHEASGPSLIGLTPRNSR